MNAAAVCSVRLPAIDGDCVPGRIGRPKNPRGPVPGPNRSGVIEIVMRIIHRIGIRTPIVEPVKPVIEALLAGRGQSRCCPPDPPPQRVPQIRPRLNAGQRKKYHRLRFRFEVAQFA